MIRNLKYIFLVESTKNLDIFVSLFCIWWGSWLLLPFSTFATSYAFVRLATLPEELYGIFVVGVAGATLYYSLKEKANKYLYFLMALWWLTVAILITQFQWRNTGVPVYWVLFLIYAFLYIRHAYEERK